MINQLKINEKKEIQILQNILYILIMKKNIDLTIFNNESEDLDSNKLEDLRKSKEEFND